MQHTTVTKVERRAVISCPQSSSLFSDLGREDMLLLVGGMWYYFLREQHLTGLNGSVLLIR